MKKNLKILIAASEITPLAKVGGLGDVIGALPKALAKLNLDVRVIIPFYGGIDRDKYRAKLIKNDIPVNGQTVSLWQTFLPETKIPVYLIKHELFKSRNIYHSALADSQTDIEKFTFFSQAVSPALETVNFQPNVIHLNDWHTAAISSRSNSHTLLTIHNLANQGIMQTGKHNLLAEGILNSNLINTVSPTYAKEILTKEYGAGLEKILAQRKNQLYGILNGLDTNFFNPAADKFIHKNFSGKSLKEKVVNKLNLQRQLGWPEDKNTALVGLVTRFVRQKGVDLITEKFASLNCRFIFLGTGEKKYEQALMNLEKKYPDKFKTQIKFDEKLAHQIYAASDIFLVPSRFEPCGLTQMIAMRYGAVPVVRSTGGLKDTVNNNNGFSFKRFNSDKFYKTLGRALNIFYHQPKIWHQLQLNGIKKNFSWDKPAKQYLKLYRKLAH